MRRKEINTSKMLMMMTTMMTMIKTKMKTKRKRRTIFGRESQRSVREQI